MQKSAYYPPEFWKTVGANKKAPTDNLLGGSNNKRKEMCNYKN